MSTAVPRPAPVAAPAPRAHWTPAKQRIFLTALLETGSIARAAAAAGMSRSSAHRLRQRLAGTAFDRQWDQCLAAFARGFADPFGAAAAPQAGPCAPPYASQAAKPPRA
jgi:hypothetical protein